MPMNLVIQQKRKALGLTQEQIADYLNVSTPAVSKWERGVTCPDVELLPSLARLLKTDLNTLLCFREELTEQDLAAFCQEVNDLFQREGIQSAFDATRQKIHDYPHNEMLMYALTIQLDGLMNMAALPDEAVYDEELENWYNCLAASSDPKISNAANYMLVGRSLRRGDDDRAQEILDRMPDRRDILGTMADKLLLQVSVYQHRGQTDRAAEELQRALLGTVNKAQILLYKLVEAELAAGAGESAKAAAEGSVRLTDLFGLWKYGGLVAPLQLSLAEQKGDEAVEILESMLNAMAIPWDRSRAPLFSRIGSVQSNQKQMLPAILKELEQDPGYDFLRDREDFRALIAAYQEKAKQ